jgi:HD-like signal output (HDOD) protein
MPFLRAQPGSSPAPAGNNLPSFRPLVLKVMQMARNEEMALPRLVEVLRTDVAFAAEILRFANSALFPCRHEVKSLLHAVALLGTERVYATALTLAMREFHAADSGLGPAQWRHNMATALICDFLSRLTPYSPESCYIAGLIHDVGRAMLLRSHPSLRATAPTTADSDFDVLAAERRLCGTDHCQMGRWLLGQWGFPLQLQNVAAFHHAAGPVPPRDANLIALVHLAWQIGDVMGFSWSGRSCRRRLSDILAPLPEDQRKYILANYVVMQQQVITRLNAVEISLR